MKTSAFNKKSKGKIEYPNLPSAVRPIPHSDKFPVPVFKQLPPTEDLSQVEEHCDCNDPGFEFHEDSVLRGFDQHE